jgi:4-alpha-glucanotransferase
MRSGSSRRAGVLVPLFSIPSSSSWGIGEIGDVTRLSRWLEAAGIRVLQLLPINEIATDDSSPYSALSAMATDPQFISLERLEDFAALGGDAQLDPDVCARLDAVRRSPVVDYAGVRELKGRALRRSFAHFRDTEWRGGTRRSAALRAYIRDQGWWLDDYALFRALHARHGERAWTEWPEPLRTRRPDALAAAREELAEDILYRQYLQWIADGQWADMRRDASGLSLFGDLSFMVGVDSADVWTHQDEFRLDASAGVPPDAFSPSGQDWGLPVYRWDVLAERDFDWLRDRGRRMAALFDGYRVDHLVGFYRTYFRPYDGAAPAFMPADEDAQMRQGESVLSLLQDAGAEIVAEDLGTVPDFVRESLARLGVAGYKVLRWERHWHREGQPFKDPLDYPVGSVATSGTHDTEPIVVWWEKAPRAEREAVLAIPSLSGRLAPDDRARALDSASLTDSMREALLETLFASGANLLILPMQDLFGWRDRINEPATVGPSNWTWRLPWPSDRLAAEPAAMAVATQIREWGRMYGRSSPSRLSA